MRSTRLVLVLSAIAILALFADCARADSLVFSSGFEYAGGSPSPAALGNDAANLNGADGQVGTFSGAVPNGSGGGTWGANFLGFLANPNGGQGLFPDRAATDGSFSANLTSEVATAGATVSFDVATRRTQGNSTAKDYDIVGFDSGGNESFHLRIDTNNDDPSRRVKVVTNNGATETTNLPTTSGNDADADIPNWGVGGSPSGANLDSSEIASILLNLTDSGYTIDFQSTNNSYVSDLIDFNGTADTLSRIEFQFSGGADTLSSGFFIDNLSVTAAAVPEPASIAIWSLLGLALAGFGFYRTRRKKSAFPSE